MPSFFCIASSVTPLVSGEHEQDHAELRDDPCRETPEPRQR
jgi:hypothetical protein